MKKDTLFFTLLVMSMQLTVSPLLCQQHIDSLESVLKTEALNRTERINLLNELSWRYLEVNPVMAEKKAMDALKLAEQEKDMSLLLVVYHRLGTALYNRNQLKEAKSAIQKAFDIANELQEPVGGIFQTMGNIEADLGNYEQALDNYLQALRLFEKQNDLSKTGQTLSNIGALYINLGNIEKSYEYNSKALAIHRKTGYKMGIAANLANMSDYYFENNDTVQTFLALTEAIELFHELNATIHEANILGDLGDYYTFFLNDHDKAIETYNQSLSLLSPNDNNNLWLEAYRKMSLAYYRKADYKKALEYLRKGIAVTDTANLDFVRMNHYLLTYYHIGLKDVENATEAFDNYVKLTNKVYAENQTKNIAEMEIKYETEKKELKIAALERDKQLIFWLSIAGTTILLLLSVLLWVRHRLMKNRKELAEQQVLQLEQEKQLVATQAVLEGETTERSRLARDLHDGLGGLLTSMKLSLGTMEEKVFLDDNGRKMFANALGLLDLSVKELHQVANNMMPESLLNYGLKTAIENFVKNLDTKESCKLSFSFYGSESRFMPDFEMTVYRMVQELYNNALKHADAAEIFLQLVVDDNRLNVSYEDNGKGFNTECLSVGKGMGLSNIITRTKAFGGQMEITSAPGQGTQVTIEFNNTDKFLKHDSGLDS